MPALLALAFVLLILRRGNDAPMTPTTSTKVDGWISTAGQVLDGAGVSRSLWSPDDVKVIIRFESGGDPTAENDWDINFVEGHPSQGLMQTIPSTFAAYALPGYDVDILDPVSNIIAGVRYAIATYGSTSRVPGVVAVREGKPYVGY